MIIGITQLALLVKDYDEAIDFYCDKLHFTLIEDTQLPTKRWVRLCSQGKQGSELLLTRAVTEEQISTVGRQAGGRVLFYLQTDDFEADYARLTANGVKFSEESREEIYGKVAVFLDLYGNRIDLIQSI